MTLPAPRKGGHAEKITVLINNTSQTPAAGFGEVGIT